MPIYHFSYKVKITDFEGYFPVIRQILSQASTTRSEQIITANAVCILFFFSLSMVFIQINFYNFLFC